MAVTVTPSNHAKHSFATKKIDLANDTVKVLLMRTGFVFNKDLHAVKANIKGSIVGSNNITFVNATKKITKATGGFTAAGFVIGNKIAVTGTASNNGTFTVTAVSDTEITTSETPVDESNVSATLTGADELATGSGYTQDTKTTGTITVTEDDANDIMSATFPTVTWTASGGSIGPTPGAILYDDTSSDDTILGYIDFGAEITTINGVDLKILNGEIRIS